jgi:hypothetical protein
MTIRFLYSTILEGCFLAQNEDQSPNINNMSVRFPHGMVIFWTGVLFFLYIKWMNFRKQIPYPKANRFNTISRIPLKIRFLQFFRGSSLYTMSTKALTQTICLRDFRVTWPFYERRFVLCLYKVYKKYHILESVVKTPFIWFSCKFMLYNFVLYAQYEN